LQEFTRAQELKNVRTLKIRIVNEELILDSVVLKQGNAKEDFTNNFLALMRKIVLWQYITSVTKPIAYSHGF